MTTYRIKNIMLRNITSHTDTKLEFPEIGSIALVGPNGAGKSSIVEAIYSALTLESLRGGKYDIVRSGSKRGEIRVTLDNGKDVIEAWIRYMLSPRANTKEVILKKNGKIIATNDQSYRSEIAKLLGIQRRNKLDKLLKRTVIIPQGGLRDIIDRMSKPKDFRELIEESIGIPEYRKALDKLSNIVLEEMNEASGIPRISSKEPLGTLSSSKRITSLIKKINNVKENIEQLEKEIKLEKANKERIEVELKQIRQIINKNNEHLEALRKKREELVGEVKLLEDRKKELDLRVERLNVLKKDLEDALKAREELDKLKTMINLSDKITNLSKIKERIVSLEKELNELDAIITAYNKLKESEEKAREYEIVKSNLEKLLEEKLDIKNKLSKIENIIEINRNYIARIEEYKKSILKLLNMSGEEKITDIGKIRVKIDKTEESLRSLTTELDEVKGELSITISKLEESRKALEALEKSIEPKCPVCGSPLTKERKIKLIENFKEKIRKLEEKKDILLKRLENLQAQITEKEDVIRESRRMLNNIESLLSLADMTRLEEL